MANLVIKDGDRRREQPLLTLNARCSAQVASCGVHQLGLVTSAQSSSLSVSYSALTFRAAHRCYLCHHGMGHCRQPDEGKEAGVAL